MTRRAVRSSTSSHAFKRRFRTIESNEDVVRASFSSSQFHLEHVASKVATAILDSCRSWSFDNLSDLEVADVPVSSPTSLSRTIAFEYETTSLAFVFSQVILNSIPIVVVLVVSHDSIASSTIIEQDVEYTSFVVSIHVDRQDSFRSDIELRREQASSVASIRVCHRSVQLSKARTTRPSPIVVSIFVFNSPASRDTIESISVRDSVDITSSSDIFESNNIT